MDSVQTYSCYLQCGLIERKSRVVPRLSKVHAHRVVLYTLDINSLTDPIFAFYLVMSNDYCLVYYQYTKHIQKF